MTHTSAATLSPGKPTMHPAEVPRSTPSLQHAIIDLIFASALAPFAAFTPTTDKLRKAAAPRTGRRLGAVVTELRQAKALTQEATNNAASGPAPRMPRGAQYLERTHRCAAGSRSYRLYLPASQPTRPNGLIMMLHACNQTPDDFAAGTHMNALAEKHGLAIAYPEQTRRGNAASCWNWFNPAHQTRGAGEPAILASLARELMQEFGLGRDAVFVAGLSSGGAMAAILADVYPDVFSAAGIHSGMARGAVGNAISAILAMRSGASGGLAPVLAVPAQPVRWIIFQGADDSTVHRSNAAMILVAALGDDAVPTRISTRSAGGRDYARSDYAGSDGATQVEAWMIEDSGHAWSGGRAGGSHVDTKGPDASAQMIRFFLASPA
ncbi:extracellular catalytic domain type 1 short-chain-length polyhydroxyalkanoate depolymerase [Paracoccus salsus]|uniref:extracellular catalytic domain type 1 short-chain-length polyhydroxyalkanoate depolymerase n=1 Tax=Paracoccus salsus TaxID=2911061 RepID=UPI001F33A057|nr:PHB depolymerase family esterase [Paracoccus salsus]MCF3974983.1 PHB depolymerase family esterase [Paracoccus salsus]